MAFSWNWNVPIAADRSKTRNATIDTRKVKPVKMAASHLIRFSLLPARKAMTTQPISGKNIMVERNGKLTSNTSFSTRKIQDQNNCYDAQTDEQTVELQLSGLDAADNSAAGNDRVGDAVDDSVDLPPVFLETFDSFRVLLCRRCTGRRGTVRHAGTC